MKDFFGKEIEFLESPWRRRRRNNVWFFQKE